MLFRKSHVYSGSSSCKRRPNLRCVLTEHRIFMSVPMHEEQSPSRDGHRVLDCSKRLLPSALSVHSVAATSEELYQLYTQDRLVLHSIPLFKTCERPGCFKNRSEWEIVKGIYRACDCSTRCIPLNCYVTENANQQAINSCVYLVALTSLRG